MPRLCFSVTGRASGCRHIQGVHENGIKHHTIVHPSFGLHHGTQSRHLCHLHREMKASITIHQEKPLRQAEAEQAYRKTRTSASFEHQSRLTSQSEAQTQNMATLQKENTYNAMIPLRQRPPNLSVRHLSHPKSRSTSENNSRLLKAIGGTS